MARREITERTARFVEINDPKRAVGLWSHHVERETAIFPEGRTRETINRYLGEDVARHRTFAEARMAMLAKDDESDKKGEKRKTAPQKLREYEEEFHQPGVDKIPAWFYPWRRYAGWLDFVRGEGERSKVEVEGRGRGGEVEGGESRWREAVRDVRMSFDAPGLGVTAHEGNLHRGRMFFLRHRVTQPPTTNTQLPTTNQPTTSQPSEEHDFAEAIGCVLKTHRASTAHFQRKLGWGYNHASKMIDLLVARGVIAKRTGMGPNEILMGDEALRDMVGGDPRAPRIRFDNERGVVAGNAVAKGLATLPPHSTDSQLPTTNQPTTNQPTTHYHYYVAIVLKPGGTKWWDQIDNTNVTWTDKVYERLQIDPRGELRWGPMLREVIDERVEAKEMCLFTLDDDALFRAITDSALNPHEKYAHLNSEFKFYVRDPDAPVKEFYLAWSVMFNPKRGKYNPCDRSRAQILEIARERKKAWAKRAFEAGERVGGESRWTAELSSLARRVVTENGCIVLPNGASDEMRLAAAHALFFVTFPERRPDELGGILRGYQLPGRVTAHAAGQVRGKGDGFVERRQKEATAQIAARRTLVVDTLLARAARTVASRNGIAEDDARRRIESVNGRATLEAAAKRWGMLDGNALKLFKPKPTAGALKLPDLSLALGFELRLGLDGAKAGVARLVQTAKIRPLDAAAGAMRESIAGRYALSAMWRPMPGREKAAVAPRGETMRVLHDETGWYLLALPRYGQLDYARDLLFPNNQHPTNYQLPTNQLPTNQQPISAYHFESASGGRTRQDVRLVVEQYEWNKVIKLAHEGRLYFWRIDFGADAWLAEAAYSPENAAPCRLVATNYQLPTNQLPTTLSLVFIVNAHMGRDYAKSGVRDWQSYCWAYPEEAKRAAVAWEGEGAESVARCVAEDGVLFVDREHAAEAMRAMTYVVVAGRGAREPGGAYNGYSLRDRVFVGTPTVGLAVPREPHSENNESCVVETNAVTRGRVTLPPHSTANQPTTTLAAFLGPRAKEYEKLFVAMIERDGLADRKSAAYFELEAPIEVKGEAVAAAVAREFGRIVHTGTMGYERQMIRPAHEVAVGLWLARLGF